MPTELIIILIAGLLAGVLIAGVFVASRGDEDPARSFRTGGPRRLPALGAEAAPDKYAAAERAEGAGGGRFDTAGYGRAVRVAWWVSIAAVMAGIGISGAFTEAQPLIYAVAVVAAVVVVVLHEVLPQDWRIPGRAWIEAAIALALVTAVVLLTGRGTSPFVVGYPIVTVGMALARGPRAAAFFALLATAAYIAVLPDPGSIATAPPSDLLRYGANIGGIWLITGLAGAYAAQERRSRDRFVRLSVTDPLTGLFNRSQILATLDSEIRRTRRSERGFCVLMIDLDGLKAVNDSAGHHRGDDVLRHLGTVIRRSIRTVDSAYRYGGDEFVVLLPETEIIGAFVVAEKIRSGTEELSVQLEIEGIDASVSIGLVSHPEDGLTVEELMLAADRAMYQAKSLGKNQISGYPRPRRQRPALPPAAEGAPLPAAVPATEGAPAPEAAPEMQSSPSAEPVATAEEPVPSREPLAEPVGLRPVEMGAGGSNGGSVAVTPERAGDEEPDPGEVRRQIAAASRSFDPDHQIRRAMDAFLGPMGTESGETRDQREH